MYSKTPRRPLPELDSPEDSSDQEDAFHMPVDSMGGTTSTTAEVDSVAPSEKTSKYRLSRQRKRQR